MATGQNPVRHRLRSCVTPSIYRLIKPAQVVTHEVKPADRHNRRLPWSHSFLWCYGGLACLSDVDAASATSPFRRFEFGVQHNFWRNCWRVSSSRIWPAVEVSEESPMKFTIRCLFLVTVNVALRIGRIPDTVAY